MNTYRSAVDPWLIGSLLAAFLAAVFAVTTSFEAPLAITAGVITTTLAAVLGIYGLLWPCAYQLTHEALVVKIGLIMKRIPYRTIESVEPVRSIESAPALSLNRLCIRHKSGYVLISPRDQKGFCKEIVERIDALNIDAD